MSETQSLRLNWDGWGARVGPLSLSIFDGANGGGWEVHVSGDRRYCERIAHGWDPGSELKAKLLAEEAAWKWLNAAVEAWGGIALNPEQVEMASEAVWAQRAELVARPDYYGPRGAAKAKQLIELARHMTVDIRVVETLASKPKGA